jgi:uncharacterized membrane protein YgdD (TMEM256/DUF423 family)
MHKPFIITAACIGALTVALGAFAAHSLKAKLPAESLQIFETAVRYQFYHGFALLATGILYKEFPVKLLQWAGRFFIAGIILFSGSLYVLSIANPNTINWVGAITPLGGLCFIAGWVLMAVAVIKKNNVV